MGSDITTTVSNEPTIRLVPALPFDYYKSASNRSSVQYQSTGQTCAEQQAGNAGSYAANENSFAVDTLAYQERNMRLSAPSPGQFYFGVYASSLEAGYVPLESTNPRCPPDPPGQSNQPYSDAMVHTRQATESFLCAISSDSTSFRPAIVHFWNDWGYGDKRFPTEIVKWIEELGTARGGPAPVPYVSLNTRSHHLNYFVDPVFTLDSIIRGEWDEELHAWGKAAAKYGKPMLVTWAPECNGEFKPHNAIHYGGPKKTLSAFPAQNNNPHDESYLTGHERFRMAFRKVVEVIRSAGASNIQWVLHIIAGANPSPWNRFENYYAGPDVVDWFGVSVYGAQNPDPNEHAAPFDELFNDVYWRIQEIDVNSSTGQQQNTPIIVTEMGCAMALQRDANPPDRASAWADNAFYQILARTEGDWKNLKGFTWWNESWLNVRADNPNQDIERSVMRVQENAALRKVFHQRLLEMREQSALVESPVLV